MNRQAHCLKRLMTPHRLAAQSLGCPSRCLETRFLSVHGDKASTTLNWGILVRLTYSPYRQRLPSSLTINANRADEFSKAFGKPGYILELALPYSCYLPSLCVQLGHSLPISGYIPSSLVAPVRDIGLGLSISEPTIMAMPKTSVEKYHLPTSEECDIRRAGKLRSVKSIPVSEIGKATADGYFGLSILGPN